MFCPDCGLQARNTAKFCNNCGFKLQGKQILKPAVRKRSSIKSKVHSNPVSSSSKKVFKKVKRKIFKQQVPLHSAPSDALMPQIVMPTSGSLSIGTVLDRRYEIVQHIATGGMGAIYKGEDSRLKTTIAIKEMLDFFSNHEDRKYAIQRFTEEALLLADLRHPNIPRVTDHFIEQSRYYLIMDFVDGKSTMELLRENGGGGLPINRAVTWAIQICDVLHYLHIQNPPIIYRDMKPSNVMIRDDDSVMLVDFGIARHFTPRRPGTMIGTHGYAPPEQYKGKTEPRSDLYALAATLHHLISGNDPTLGIPFKFKPIRAWRKDASERLEMIFLKALNNRVEMRYTDGFEMKKAFMALEQHLSGGTRSYAFSLPNTNVKKSKKPSTSAPHAPSYQHIARTKSSKDAQNYFIRAKNYADNRRYYRARKELDKALRLSPNYPEAHSLMGYVLTRLGKTKQAMEHLNKAISLSPGSATAHFYMGKAYDKMGRLEDSQKEYRIAGNLDPQLFKRHSESFLERLIRSFLA